MKNQAVCGMGVYLFSACLALTTNSAIAEELALGDIENVFITGTKRSQKFNSIDGAVSLQVADQLEAAGIDSVDQLEWVFPGLVIDMRGNRNYTNFTLRGLTSGDFYNPSVQVYVDGAPQDPAFLSQELLNVKQIELLRGPQGTLYGRNAQGGIINIVSTPTGEHLAAKVDAEYSGYAQQLTAGVSGPLSKALGGALTIHRRDIDGQIDDVATGESDVDDVENLLARVRLVYAPQTSALNLALTLQHADIDSNEELYLSDQNIATLSYDSVNQGGISEFQREVNAASFTADYDLGSFKFSSVSAYQDRDISRRVIQGFDTPEQQETLSQELRLASQNRDGVAVVLGLFYEYADFKRNTPFFPGFFGVAENLIQRDTVAIFGEASYGITETLDLSFGLRWSREEVEIDYASEAPSSLNIQEEDSFEDISPKISLGWQLAKNQRIYGLVSRGFKAGGFNNTIALGEFDANRDTSYNSETNTNIELGWIGRLFEGRMENRLAFYHINTADKQSFTGPIGLQYLRNIGDAESSGVEFESRMAFGSTVVELGAAFGRSEYKTAIDQFGDADYSDNSLPHAPDSTVRVAIDQGLPTFGLPGKLFLRLGMQHVGKTFFDDANTLSQPSYELFDASLRMELERLSLRFFINNLSDEIYRTYSFNQGPAGNFSSVGVRRNIGLRLAVTL